MSILSTAAHAAGKTTLLRDVTGLLAERFGRRVVVVDTSNEIGGDGKVPHSCIGRARRMPVQHKSKQHEVLQEAVQNHNPQVRLLAHNCCNLLAGASAADLQLTCRCVFDRRWQACHAHKVTWRQLSQCVDSTGHCTYNASDCM